MSLMPKGTPLSDPRRDERDAATVELGEPERGIDQPQRRAEQQRDQRERTEQFVHASGEQPRQQQPVERIGVAEFAEPVVERQPQRWQPRGRGSRRPAVRAAADA